MEPQSSRNRALQDGERLDGGDGGIEAGSPRRQVFTALGIAIELWLIRQVAPGEWHWAPALPLLCALWVNAHGGVLSGIAILVCDIPRQLEDRQRDYECVKSYFRDDSSARLFRVGYFTDSGDGDAK